MRRALLILGLVCAAALGLVWATGGWAVIERAASEMQRDVQNALAGALRAIRRGEPGAVASLLALCFGYGFAHAAGPGHGKMLVGAYGLGRRVRLMPLAAIAVVSSLAQATVAIAIVYAGVALLGLGRERLVGLAEGYLTPISYALVATLGLWLCWRGLRGHLSQRATSPLPVGPAVPDLRTAHGLHEGGHDDARGHHHHHHAHSAVQGPACTTCGHSHGPSVEDVARLTGFRDVIVLIGSIAIRPCTGALFLLILTVQMGIGGIGVAGAYAMGLGTATVTLAVAGLSVWAREGAFATLPGARLTRALPLVELAAGLVIAVAATSLMVAAL